MDVDLKLCARCGGEHLKMRFEPLTNPTDKFAWWAACPVNGEPILLARVIRCQCGKSEWSLGDLSPDQARLLNDGKAWTIGKPEGWTAPWPPSEGDKLALSAEMRAKLIRHFFGGGKTCGPDAAA